jgi:hypothetical protein
MNPLPKALWENNAQARGARGLDWLDRLPQIITTCEERWSFAVQSPFEDLSFDYAAPAVSPAVSVMRRIAPMSRSGGARTVALRG